jgi:hypothetical protein
MPSTTAQKFESQPAQKHYHGATMDFFGLIVGVINTNL